MSNIILPTAKDAEAIRRGLQKLQRVRGAGAATSPDSLAIRRQNIPQANPQHPQPQHWFGVITDATTLADGWYKVKFARFQSDGTPTAFPTNDPRRIEVHAINVDEIDSTGHAMAVGAAVTLFWTWSGDGTPPYQTFYFWGTAAAIKCVVDLSWDSTNGKLVVTYSDATTKDITFYDCGS